MRLLLASGIIFLSAALGALGAFSQSPATTTDEVHEHAKFAVVMEGSRKDMSSEAFQLNARDVHLEGGSSHIVHKHAEGVTWRRFLDTLPVEFSEAEASDICVRILEEESCGEGSVILNGEQVSTLDREISQDDSLLIIVSTEDWRSLSKDFEDTPLPDAYRPFWLTGTEV